MPEPISMQSWQAQSQAQADSSAFLEARKYRSDLELQSARNDVAAEKGKAIRKVILYGAGGVALLWLADRFFSRR